MGRERRGLVLLGKLRDHAVGRAERILSLGEQLDEPGVPAEELRELVDR